MAGPDIPRWQAQQGVQAGAMGQAYDRAGALFGKVMESAQGILDQKIESESVPFLEGMLTAENTDDLAVAREGGLANKWADQAKLGAANIAQTKEIKQQERDAAAVTAAAEMAQKEYELKADDLVLKGKDLDRKIKADAALDKRERARISKIGQTSAQKEAAQKVAANLQLASFLHESKTYASKDGNARDTALTSFQAAVRPEDRSGNISEAVLAGNVNAFMDQKERELYLTGIAEFTKSKGALPNDKVAEGIREQSKKTLAAERAAALKYANVYSTEGMAALRGKENAFISQTPIRGNVWYSPRDNTSADATVLAKTIRSVLDPEDANTVYDTITAPTNFDQVEQVAPVIYSTITDAIIRQMSAQYPPEVVRKMEQYARTEIDGRGFESLGDVTDKIAKFRQEEAQTKLIHSYAKAIEGLEKTWGVGKAPVNLKEKARELLVETISEEMGETPAKLGIDKRKFDRIKRDPFSPEAIEAARAQEAEGLEEVEELLRKSSRGR